MLIEFLGLIWYCVDTDVECEIQNCDIPTVLN